MYIRIGTIETHKIIMDYYEQLWTNKFDNLKNMGKLLNTYNLPQMNHEEMENLNGAITG